MLAGIVDLMEVVKVWWDGKEWLAEVVVVGFKICKQILARCRLTKFWFIIYSMARQSQLLKI